MTIEKLREEIAEIISEYFCDVLPDIANEHEEAAGFMVGKILTLLPLEEFEVVDNYWTKGWPKCPDIVSARPLLEAITDPEFKGGNIRRKE